MNENTIADLKGLKKDLLKKIASIDEILEFMQLQSSMGALLDNGLNNVSPLRVSGTYKEKIAAVLSNENRFLNVTQIIDIINLASPLLSRDEIKAGVNSAKSILLKDGSIVKVTAGKSNQNSFYGSPKWLDNHGNVIPSHMYDESLIKERTKIEI